MRSLRLLVIVLISSMLLAGCLYPESEKTQNRIPDDLQIEMVQNAVDQFQENSEGLLPIKTQEDQREYLEYQVDFTALVPTYLDQRPDNAYEAGGNYQYVIIDAEEDPKVKLADLRITDEIRSLTIRLNTFGENVELGEPIGPNVYPLDLNFYEFDKNPTVTSPYTESTLNVYYNGGQQFIVDYREDIGRIMKENDLEFETGEDVRHVLYEYTPIVPIYSPEITVNEENRPIFMTNRHKSD
ncbi:hypothetical protein ACFOLA_01535 [Salinicoccus hispanicus]|uniref:ABC transporter periplasmic binding protein yphF n=1 Tax=Salinicoccus hispanicus TaxID=157225 RepID=A0A6N8U3L4_9STAP|nr:hypothetical protein [Salinicoccus hispanicus]MXQ50269.1 hypothetical protein [Salinicoccus hispanicus]